jgi:hypothetical protein
VTAVNCIPSGADNDVINELHGRMGAHAEGHGFKSWSDDQLYELSHVVAFISSCT